MCKRNGNPRRKSRFICLRCMKENQLGDGIQHGKHQRSKWHIKDLTCFNPKCAGMITKNIEVRFCDDYGEVFNKAIEIRGEYYDERIGDFDVQRSKAS